jgi:hypothetical protein
MKIEEMHITFRELAQQMGMQTTRAILMEDIDICLNAAIMDITKELIYNNVAPLPYSDKIARQNAAISPINGLRTLYRTNTIHDVQKTEAVVEEGEPSEPISVITGEGTEVNPYTLTISSTGIMLYVGFKISYNGSTLYDCRIIESEDLGQTLRDFCNRATKDAPICTIEGDADSINVKMITGRTSMTKPVLVQYLYIAEPNKVYYDEDNSNKCVDCDLPPYLHMDVVKRAVDVYLRSIGAVNSSNKKDS